MRGQTSLYILALLFIIAGCAPPPAPGTPVDHVTACQSENNNQRVSLEGYPRLSNMTLVTSTLSVYLFEQPNGGGDKISIYVRVGNGANQVEDLPDDYTDADLKLHTNTNQVVSSDTRIRATGTLVFDTYQEGNIICFISSVDLIEIVSDEQ